MSASLPKDASVRKVLIYRLGSLGDTVLALPAFHLVRRRFPEAEISLLTHLAGEGKAPSLAAILKNTDLFQEVISYPLHMRTPRAVAHLARTLRSKSFDLAIHLAESRGRARDLRDLIFFRLCGVRRVIGVPGHRRHVRLAAPGDSHEWEAQRLVKRLCSLGEVDLTDGAWWDLRLTESELGEAKALLGKVPRPFLSVSVGTKADAKDWGKQNWRALLAETSKLWPRLGLVLIGAKDEWDVSQCCSSEWRGTVLNLCGQTSPRVSAAILKEATLFLGHDSGPMHLAAAVGTRCVAVFSARSLPGQWYPRGDHNRIIYRQTECFGCGLDRCVQHAKKCLTSITVQEVLVAVKELMEQSAPLPQRETPTRDERPVRDHAGIPVEHNRS